MAATYSKPTVIPRWADIGTRTEPSEAEKDSGWVTLQKPPAEFFNWIDGYTGDWLKWGNERFADGLAGASVLSILNPNDGTRQLETIQAGGIKLFFGLNLGFDGPAPFGQLSVVDANFAMVGDALEPYLAFDGSGESLKYERAANKFVFSASAGPVLALQTGRFLLGGISPTLPVEVSSAFTGTLGSVATDYLDLSRFAHLVVEDSALLHYGYRHAAGATWQSASHYLHGDVAGVLKGFVRFSGDLVASADYNIGTHVGMGAGARGAAASLFVDATAAYAHSFLPRTYYGLAGALSEIGSSARPWGTIWMRDSTGTDAHINATGSAAPGKLTLEVFEGVTSRGVVKLIGNAVLASSRVDCTGIGYIDALEVRSRTGDPLSGRGFGLTSGVGLPLYSGLFGSPDGEGVRIWRKGIRSVDVIGRSGFDSDVQFTLGRGSGAGATVADLREYACVCQDFLSQDAIARGDLVRVSAAADQSVARTTTLSETGAIGFAVEDIGNGSIGRIATSGVVIARADGAPGVTRGNYVQASGVVGRVQNLATFGPACVGIALKTVAADEYFPLLIRFGG